MTKWFSVCVAATALAASTACNNTSNSPNGPSSTQATLNVSIRPSPITATRCNPQCTSTTGANFSFSAAMTISVQEAAGIGASINSITVSGTADNVSFQPIVYSSNDISSQAGTNHVTGHATLSIPVTIVYSTPSGNANLAINLSIQATDDQNHQVSASAQVNVI